MALPGALTLVLVPLQGGLNLVSDMLLFLLVTVVVALVGGLLPALVAAVVGSVLLNYYFTPPLHTLTSRDRTTPWPCVVFVVVAILVSSVVDLAARRTRQAARAAAESGTLANLARQRPREGDALARDAGAGAGDVRADLGHAARTTRRASGCRSPATATRGCSTGPGRGRHRGARRTITCVLALRGGRLRAEDQRVVGAFAAQAAAGARAHRLGRTAADAAALAEADRMRTALLAAVGHDLRTPLASAKAAVTSLRSDDIDAGPTATATSCSPPRTSPSTGSPAWSTTCST